MTLWMVKPVLVLDLDGTVRYNKNDKEGFINKPEDVAIFEDVEAKLWEYKDKGFLIFGASNQGGVAFGHKTAADAVADMERTRELFERDPFDTVAFCPYHPEGTVPDYAFHSLWRKPQIGMLSALEAEWRTALRCIIDWPSSIVVGDRAEDAELAQNAGIDFIWADQFFGREQA